MAGVRQRRGRALAKDRLVALPVAPASLETVRAMSVRTRVPGLVISGKTGSGKEHGWFVAQIDRNGRRSWLALLLRGEGATGMKGEAIVHRLLGVP